MPPPTWTNRDLEILRFAFLSQRDDSSFKVDYARLAELAGFKTAASANTCWLLVKKKVMAVDIGEASSLKPKIPRHKSKANTDAQEADNAGEEEESKPTKKRSRTIKPAGDARKRAKTVSSPLEEDDNGHLSRASPLVKKEDEDKAFHTQYDEDTAI